MMKMALTALCTVSASIFAGEIMEFPEKADWQDSKNLKTLPGDVLEFSKGVAFSTEAIKVQAGKDTLLSGEFRCPEPGKKVRIYFAFNPLDAQKKGISAYHVNTILNSDTVLAAPAKKGDLFIKVKDGSKFSRGTKAAFHTKKDFSDLPNRELSSGFFKSSEKLSDGTWIIHLTLKLHKDYPAGTGVRAHGGGGYQYAVIHDLTDTKWRSLKGMVKGMAKKGMGGRLWAPGSHYANIVIFSNGKAPVQFRNIKCEIKEPGKK